jgi:hypothetical protein
VSSCNVSCLLSCLGEDSGHRTKDLINFFLKNVSVATWDDPIPKYWGRTLRKNLNAAHEGRIISFAALCYEWRETMRPLKQVSAEYHARQGGAFVLWFFFFFRVLYSFFSSVTGLSNTPNSKKINPLASLSSHPQSQNMCGQFPSSLAS